MFSGSGDPLIGVVVLVAAASIFAALFRASRIPGGRGSAALAGGLLAGLLLGPVVMGRVAPDLHRRLVLGGDRQHAALIDLARNQGAESEALLAAGSEIDALRSLADDHAEAREPLENELSLVERRFALFQFGAAFGLVGAAVLLAARCTPPGAWRLASFETVVPVALGAVFFAAVPTALVAMWLLGVDRVLAITIGSAVAAGTCLGGLPMSKPLAPDVTPTSRAAGALTCLIACAVLAAAAPATQPWIGVLAGAAVLGYALRAVLPRAVAGGRGARAIIYAIVIPAATAAVAVRIDPALIVGWKPILFVALGLMLGGDGQLLGAWLGTHLGGPAHHCRRAHMIWIDAFGLGLPATQIVLALVLLASGVIDPHTTIGASVLAAILLGALSAELMTGPTRRMALRYHEEIHQLKEPGA